MKSMTAREKSAWEKVNAAVKSGKYQNVNQAMKGLGISTGAYYNAKKKAESSATAPKALPRKVVDLTYVPEPKGKMAVVFGSAEDIAELLRGMQ